MQADLVHLSKIMEEHGSETTLANASTSGIVYLQTAYQAVNNQTLFPNTDLEHELESRQGDCRGGFADMVREARSPKSECSI